ncbi:MAG: hypothetical protein AB7V32_07000 [Candidatus Berkiella sp.]
MKIRTVKNLIIRMTISPLTLLLMIFLLTFSGFSYAVAQTGDATDVTATPGYPTLTQCRKGLGNSFDEFQQKMNEAHDVTKATINRVMANYIMNDAALEYDPRWFEAFFGPLNETSKKEVRTVLSKVQAIYNKGNYMIVCLGNDHVGSYVGAKTESQARCGENSALVDGTCHGGGAAFKSIPMPMIGLSLDQISVQATSALPVYKDAKASFCSRIADDPTLRPDGWPFAVTTDSIAKVSQVDITSVDLALTTFHEFSHSVNLCGPEDDHKTGCIGNGKDPWEGNISNPDVLIYDFGYCLHTVIDLAKVHPEYARRNADTYAQFLFAPGNVVAPDIPDYEQRFLTAPGQ